MPCYRCGMRQVDPEPGKPSPWHRGMVREHQVLICPDCYPNALADLTRCSRCDGVRLVRKLDQVECLSCGLARDVAECGSGAAGPRGHGGGDSVLASEVALALERVLGARTQPG